MFLNNMDLGFEEFKPVSGGPATIVRAHVLGLGDALEIGGSLLGGLLGDDDNDYPEPEVLPKTVSGESKTDFDILFDSEAEAALKDLTEQINTWATADRDFFTSTFQPYQEDIMQVNQTLLPAIEQLAGDTFEQTSKDLVSNAALKNSFRNVAADTAAGLSGAINKFASELDNLPTEEERVGQALANTELQFGKIGEQLKRDMASRGQGVSEASKRQLGIEKAKAKAGQAGVAAEAARAERRAALAEGAGVIGTAQAGQTAQLLGVQAAQNIGFTATGTQVGGVVTPGTETEKLGAGLTQSQAEKNLGSRTAASNIEHTQKGIQGAPDLDENFQLIPGEKPERKPRPKKPTEEIDILQGGGPGAGGPGVGGF